MTESADRAAESRRAHWPSLYKKQKYTEMIETQGKMCDTWGGMKGEEQPAHPLFPQ